MRVADCLLLVALCVASPTQAQVVHVPERNGPPILLDGSFTAGEWDGAVEIDAGNGVRLLLQQEAGHLFIGVKCVDRTAPIADLFVQPAGGEIHQLHASAQVGERLVVEGEEHPFVWGYSPDWQANEVRWDQARRERMVSEGSDEWVAQRETMFPYEGFEFQIRQRKFGGAEWRIRVEVAAAPDYHTPIVFPLRTRAEYTEGWLRLVLRTAQ